MTRFRAGEAVRISNRHESRHHRVPRYALGKQGVVERVCAAFGQPELLAEGISGEPFQTLYRVRLAATELWGSGAEAGVLELEVFEHWLEPVEDAR